MEQLHDRAEAQLLALAIVDTLPEPFLVLDDTLHLLAGSRCFYETFHEDPAKVRGLSVFDLSGGQWDIPGLRQLLATVVPQHTTVEGFEFEQDFAHVGRRTIHLNALPIRDESGASRMVLLAVKDITDRRVAEQEKQRLLEHTEELLEQQRTLLREMRHRIANSLQIIASILLLKARSVESEETRTHLRDVHKRLILVAAVQRQLCAAGMQDEVEIGPYMAQLCTGLAQSMTDGDGRVLILSSSSSGKIKADDAISFGLIVTELVLNALKHGFPDGRRGTIAVSFDTHGAGWRLAVSDDGIGYARDAATVHTGLGRDIVQALARHLKARGEIADGGIGSSTAVIHDASAR